MLLILLTWINSDCSFLFEYTVTVDLLLKSLQTLPFISIPATLATATIVASSNYNLDCSKMFAMVIGLDEYNLAFW